LREERFSRSLIDGLGGELRSDALSGKALRFGYLRWSEFLRTWLQAQGLVDGLMHSVATILYG
jgi:hypothetical protein